MSESKKVGFVAVYHWRVRPELLQQFLSSWEAVTLGIKAHRGGLGSKLHRAEDGTYVAYAQWPDRETWAAMGSLPSADPQASQAMQEAIEEALPPLYLVPLANLLES
jgi:quinol monooxygenase YgiN